MMGIGRFTRMFVLVFGVILMGAAGPGAEGRLALVESVRRDDLDAVVSATISRDGRYLHAASWRPATIATFGRNAETGKLALKQRITDRELLGGATTVALSPDGRLAVAVAFMAKTVALFGIDAEDGGLIPKDSARDGDKGAKLPFPIDAVFSTDGRFVHVLDDVGPSGQGAVATFRVVAGKLELVETNEGKDGCYTGGRGLAATPDGKSLLVVSDRAGTLVVADRDKETGKTSVRQVIRDEEGDVHGLSGAMGVVVSRDGRSVYVSSGRFGGDSAVSAFRFGDDGRLTLLQEFVNGLGELRGFEGGNHLAMSPDGLNLYVTATLSRSIACFRVDRATGKLTHLAVFPDGSAEAENGAAGVAVSPDGQFVYVATEDGKAISVFMRDAARKNP